MASPLEKYGDNLPEYVARLEEEVQKVRYLEKRVARLSVEARRAAELDERLDALEKEHQRSLLDSIRARARIKELEASRDRQLASKRAYKLALKEVYARSKRKPNDEAGPSMK